MKKSRNVLPYVDFSVLMIAAPSLTLASISGASERESSCERQNKTSDFFSVTLVTHFLTVMVVLLDFQGQRMGQGHHPKSD